MKRCAAIAGLAMLLSWGGPVWAEERAVVVVAAKTSPIEAITPRQVRLAFLAVPVRVEGVQVRPVLNTSDPLLHEVFLQKTIYLSDQHYRRQIVSQVFRSGGTRPAETGSGRELIELLRKAPDRISYMWRRDAHARDDLKVLQVLWEGSIQ
jgi:hypothetical protein